MRARRFLGDSSSESPRKLLHGQYARMGHEHAGTNVKQDITPTGKVKDDVGKKGKEASPQLHVSVLKRQVCQADSNPQRKSQKDDVEKHLRLPE